MTLWEHQKKTVVETIDRDYYGLFHEMGTGKTGTVITIARAKFNKEKSYLKTWVLTPLSVTRQFGDEWVKFGGERYEKNVLVVDSGSKEKKLRELKSFHGHVIVMNHEALRTPELVEFIYNWEPRILIADESHKFKTSNALGTKTLLGLCEGRLLAKKMVKIKGVMRRRFTCVKKKENFIKYRYILTGTPILRSVEDIWAQMRILSPNIFPENPFIFRKMYMVDINLGTNAKFPNWKHKKGSKEIINKIIYEHGNRVLKKDCLDLPPLIKTVASVELTTEQKRLYKEMRNGLVAYLDDKAMVAKIALTKSLRLMQITAGIFTDDEGQLHELNSNRCEVLSDVIDSLGDNKFILWTNFATTYPMLRRLLRNKGVNYGEITGGQDARTRQGIMEKFNNTGAEMQAILANQAAGGTGVNLTAASYSIYFSRGYGLGDDLQSEARNYRGGSEMHEKITRIDLVASGTIDQVVLNMLKAKQNLADHVLELRKKL